MERDDRAVPSFPLHAEACAPRNRGSVGVEVTHILSRI